MKKYVMTVLAFSLFPGCIELGGHTEFLPVAIPVALVASSPPVTIAENEMLRKPPRYYRITARFTVNNQPMVINEDFSCEEHYDHEFTTGTMRPNEQLYHTANGEPVKLKFFCSMIEGRRQYQSLDRYQLSPPFITQQKLVSQLSESDKSMIVSIWENDAHYNHCYEGAPFSMPYNDIIRIRHHTPPVHITSVTVIPLLQPVNKP